MHPPAEHGEYCRLPLLKQFELGPWFTSRMPPKEGTECTGVLKRNKDLLARSGRGVKFTRESMFACLLKEFTPNDSHALTDCPIVWKTPPTPPQKSKRTRKTCCSTGRLVWPRASSPPHVGGKSSIVTVSPVGVGHAPCVPVLL